MVSPSGSIIKVMAVLVGSNLGLVVGRLIREKLSRFFLSGVNLSTLLLGLKMVLAAAGSRFLSLSSVVGVITGEALWLAGVLEKGLSGWRIALYSKLIFGFSIALILVFGL